MEPRLPRILSPAGLSALVVVLGASGVRAGDLGDAWQHGMRGLGADYRLISDRFDTAQLQLNWEIGQEWRGGFALQAGATWSARDASGRHVAAFLGGVGFSFVRAFSPRLGVALSTDFNGSASDTAGLFISRLQARYAFLRKDDCGYELHAGPDWMHPLGSSAQRVPAGFGVALGFGVACRR